MFDGCRFLVNNNQLKSQQQYYAKAISKPKIITEIISTTNSVDEVNSIAYASF
jgi:hypothetical protein